MRRGGYHQTMDEEQLARRMALAGTILVFTVGVGIAIVIDRAWERWWKENRPDADLRASFQGTQARYRQRRDSATEIAQALGDVLAEVGRAFFGNVSP
jgi:hypothetical protein